MIPRCVPDPPVEFTVQIGTGLDSSPVCFVIILDFLLSLQPSSYEKRLRECEGVTTPREERDPKIPTSRQPAPKVLLPQQLRLG